MYSICYTLSYLNYLASKCFCENKNGFPEKNNILCENNGHFKRHTECKSDEWCVGPTKVVDATYSIESLCVKGK